MGRALEARRPRDSHGLKILQDPLSKAVLEALKALLPPAPAWGAARQAFAACPRRLPPEAGARNDLEPEAPGRCRL